MSDGPKYRQRGYKDEERSAPKSGGGGAGTGAPRPKKEGPGGRGLGAPTESVFRCNACGDKQASGVLGSDIAPDAVCQKCGAALHSCSNCTLFDTSMRFECRKFAELPERVAKKTAANACALFSPKQVSEFAKDRDAPKTDPRSAFDALFK
jgi:hypothetical protein